MFVSLPPPQCLRAAPPAVLGTGQAALSSLAHSAFYILLLPASILSWKKSTLLGFLQPRWLLLLSLLCQVLLLSPLLLWCPRAQFLGPFHPALLAPLASIAHGDPTQWYPRGSWYLHFLRHSYFRKWQLQLLVAQALKVSKTSWFFSLSKHTSNPWGSSVGPSSKDLDCYTTLVYANTITPV